MVTKYEWLSTNGDSWNTFYSPYYNAQTFTIGTVGSNENFTLDSIKLYMQKTGSPSGTMTIKIQTTDGSNNINSTVISEGTINYNAITSAAWYEISMSAASLSASTQYAICMYVPNTDSSNKIGCYGEGNQTIYAGGLRAYSTNSGADDFPNKVAVSDIYFEIWGIIPYAPSTHTELLSPVCSDVDTAVTNVRTDVKNKFYFTPISNEQQIILIKAA